jgi:hypothetical protein
MTAKYEVGSPVISEALDVPAARATFGGPYATVWRLLMLNIALQIFDGVATYNGLRLGFGEQNPLLVMAFQRWGVGPMLMVRTAFSCAALILICRTGPRAFVIPAFWMVAGFYAACSLIPWLIMLASVL